ncbi:hypothetical protein [Nocardia sp. NPDC050710]|uniref:hypothetical protein n=1 Tax=Nocardia sp. NPDC050710 TaxID=3157220 RepID=UPI0033FEF4D4
MRLLVAKFGAALVATAAVGLAAGPAAAAPGGLPLEPTPAAAEQVLLPDSGSASVYNNFMCQLRTISAQVPCMYA